MSKTRFMIFFHSMICFKIGTLRVLRRNSEVLYITNTSPIQYQVIPVE